MEMVEGFRKLADGSYRHLDQNIELRPAMYGWAVYENGWRKYRYFRLHDAANAGRAIAFGLAVPDGFIV